jgi:hypothetical protein
MPNPTTPTYVLVWGRDLGDRFAAYAFDDRRTAFSRNGHLIPTVPITGMGSIDTSNEPRDTVGGAHVIIGDLEEAEKNLSGPSQVAIYNQLTGEGVKKFESRAAGAKRLLAALAKHALPAPLPSTAASPAATPHEEKTMITDDDNDTNGSNDEFKNTDGTVTNAAEAATNEIVQETNEVPPNPATAEHAATKETPKNRVKSDERVITLKTTENPKRAGTSAHGRFGLYRTGMTVNEFIAAGGLRADIVFDSKHDYIALGPARD